MKEEILNTIIKYAYIGIVAIFGLLGKILMNMSKRGVFDNIFKLGGNQRKLDKTYIVALTSHRVFNYLARLISLDLKTNERIVVNKIIKVGKDVKAAKLYYLMLYDLFQVIYVVVSTYLETIPKTLPKADNELKLSLLVSTIVERTEQQLKKRHIPDNIINSFNVFSMFFSEISLVEETINLSYSYYDEVNDFLDVLWFTSRLINSKAIRKALSFNGEKEKMLTDEVWERIDFSRDNMLMI